jgi:hypothetical protein
MLSCRGCSACAQASDTNYRPEMKLLYGSTITLSAFLLFSLEPMVARALLPQVGGSSAVWITALAFFQLALLLGYAYTVLIATASTTRKTSIRLHLTLLAAAALSLVLPAARPAPNTFLQHPQATLFLLLSAAIGLPFLTLSTTAPLLQAWYARREQRPTPYRLFGLSNLSSLAALLAYPLLVEPYLPLNTQFLVWKAAFLVYVVLAAALTLRMRSAQTAPPPLTSPKPDAFSRRTQLLWFALPAIASFQLAAATAYLTQDIASLPLLWVVPLAAYLLSFVLAFEYPRLYQRALVVRLLAVLLFALGYFLSLTRLSVPIWLSISLFTLELLLAAWFCHGELYALRPQDTRLTTRFYLYMAAGGAAGTLLVAVLLPAITSSNFDLPLSFLLTALLLFAVTWPEGLPHRLFWSAGAALGVYLLVILHTAYAHDSLLRARNFYGSLRVEQSQLPPQAFLSRTLYNGNIQHGMQWFSDDFHRSPLSYYAHDSGVGLALDHCCTPNHPRHIGVIGLGAGTLAAYGQPGDNIRFYEINPLVIDVSQHLFTYTRDTPATVTIVPGDARLSLAADPPQNFDVLVIDAFSGDSIPTHLLTREALTLYRRHLAPAGILAFHISNQHLDLAPVLARLADTTRSDPNGPLTVREIDSGPDDDHGEALASWVLLTTTQSFFVQPALAPAVPIATQQEVQLWTDQYSSLLPILHWTGKRIRAH